MQPRGDAGGDQGSAAPVSSPRQAPPETGRGGQVKPGG